MTTAIEEIRRGFRWERVARFQKAYGLKDEAFARMIGMSPRTLARHRNAQEPLDAVASDRFWRFVRIIEFAADVFEGKEPAMKWLQRPQPGLGGRIPLDLLDTAPGSQDVQALLKQIEYGVLP